MAVGIDAEEGAQVIAGLLPSDREKTYSAGVERGIKLKASRRQMETHQMPN